MASTFPQRTKSMFEKMIVMKERFCRLDLTKLSNDQAKQELDALDDAERNVMLAWAEETADINPGMLREVKEGQLKYTLKSERFLTQQMDIES